MDFLNGKPRSSSRIKPMLEKLEEAWRLYPDMRLGQLIVVCAASNNLFGLEDDVMYERLQQYIENMSSVKER